MGNRRGNSEIARAPAPLPPGKGLGDGAESGLPPGGTEGGCVPTKSGRCRPKADVCHISPTRLPIRPIARRRHSARRRHGARGRKGLRGQLPALGDRRPTQRRPIAGRCPRLTKPGRPRRRWRARFPRHARRVPVDYGLATSPVVQSYCIVWITSFITAVTSGATRSHRTGLPTASHQAPVGPAGDPPVGGGVTLHAIFWPPTVSVARRRPKSKSG